MGEVTRTPVPEDLKPQPDAASEAQLKFIRDLMAARHMDPETRITTVERLEKGLTKKLASQWIDKLKTLPYATSSFADSLPDGSDPMPAVPAGRYALDPMEGAKFYKVDIGKPGNPRWAGFVFLSAGRGGAHGDLQWTPIKNLAAKREVLEDIARDVQGAAQAYGQLIGKCGVCGRSLTDETSREFGIGPICRADRGWA